MIWGEEGPYRMLCLASDPLLTIWDLVSRGAEGHPLPGCVRDQVVGLCDTGLQFWQA